MKSWKARLLFVFTVGALVLAVSVPAMANHPGGAIESAFGPGRPVPGNDGPGIGGEPPPSADVLPYYCSKPYSLSSEAASVCSNDPFTFSQSEDDLDVAIGELREPSDDSAREDWWSESEEEWWPEEEEEEWWPEEEEE